MASILRARKQARKTLVAISVHSLILKIRYFSEKIMDFYYTNNRVTSQNIALSIFTTVRYLEYDRKKTVLTHHVSFLLSFKSQEVH
jgi:hypothetical protein